MEYKISKTNNTAYISNIFMQSILAYYLWYQKLPPQSPRLSI